MVTYRRLILKNMILLVLVLVAFLYLQEDKMGKMRNILSGFTTKLKPSIKKSIVSALTVSALTLGTGHLIAAANSQLTTFYHVYIQNEYIGTVEDIAEVELFIEKKNESLEEQYKGVEFELGDDFSYIPEQVFHSSSAVEANEVIDLLDTKVNFMAKAYALVIDGKEVAYVSDEESAQKVLRELKLEFVTEDQLAEVEARKADSSESIPEVTDDKTSYLLDVNLSEEVSISEVKINPNEILSVEDTIKLFNKGTLEEKKYKVQPGDVLGTIATAHGLKLDQLLSLNAGLNENTVLKPEMELNVTYQKPLAVVRVDRQGYRKEEVPFEKEVINDDQMFAGDTKVKQEGKKGLKGITFTVTEENGKVIKEEIVKQEVIEEPVKEIIIKGTKVVPSRGTGSFVWPANGGYVSSNMGYRWGRMHKGMDIARPSERTLKAVDNGVIVSAGYDNGGYGNKVVIDHKNGYRTIYAHLASISVSAGQTVPRGSKIGVMGTTGDSTGIHLHIEVLKNGKFVDPGPLLGR